MYTIYMCVYIYIYVHIDRVSLDLYKHPLYTHIHNWTAMLKRKTKLIIEFLGMISALFQHGHWV